MNNRVLLGLLAVLFVGTSAVQAQKFSKVDVSPADIASYPSNYKEADKKVRVIYSRPKLTSPKTGEQRTVSALAEYGKVWRTGANEAPEITFYQDVVFGGANVKAGTYALFSIPGEDSWTIILNEQIHTWGAYTYDKNKDLVRTTAKVSNSNNDIEAFSINFEPTENGYTLFMGWGKKIASILLEKS